MGPMSKDGIPDTGDSTCNTVSPTEFKFQQGHESADLPYSCLILQPLNNIGSYKTDPWADTFKSRQNSFFLAPNSFLVRDPEQEKNFQFSLTTSLRIAQQEGGLFQGYEIHVTPNVKPEPEHMRDIVKCSGGTFLPRMPRAYKEKRIVVSCPDDLPRCKPAQDAKVPIANSEFILTGILQQKINLEAHRLDEVRTSLPASPVVPITRASKRRAVAQTAPTPPTTAKRRH